MSVCNYESRIRPSGDHSRMHSRHIRECGSDQHRYTITKPEDGSTEDVHVQVRFSFLVGWLVLTCVFYWLAHFLRCVIEPDFCKNERGQNFVLCSFTKGDSRVSTPVASLGTCFFVLVRYVQSAWIDSPDASCVRSPVRWTLKAIAWTQFISMLVYVSTPPNLKDQTDEFYGTETHVLHTYVGAQLGYFACWLWVAVVAWSGSSGRGNESTLIAFRALHGLASVFALVSIVDGNVKFNESFKWRRVVFQSISLAFMLSLMIFTASLSRRRIEKNNHRNQSVHRSLPEEFHQPRI